ncbi:GNAT family N-acetyltransferase [Marinicella litoralis]|nr:GNAT family N-acetyltransferase [Marinicella litoralis]
MKAEKWHWVEGDLHHQDVRQLLEEHQSRMAEHSPLESRHVLNIQALQRPEISFYSLWSENKLLGCVALKHWQDHLAEIKSMKTSPAFVRRGVGQRLLEYIIETAQSKGYQQLKLETGSMDYFKPARNLYLKHGFEYCEPFGDYVKDPNNVFMCLAL